MPSPIDLLPPLREVIAKHDLLARKSLGQHFLCDLNLTRKIASLAGDLTDCTAFEIGPGPGGLTRALVETDAKKIIAIEKDRRCIAALKDVIEASEGRLEVIEGDALKIDLIPLARSLPLTRRADARHPLPPAGGEGTQEKPLALQSREREGPVAKQREGEGQYAVVANLPYNIGTELLLGWLETIDEYKSLTLMFQAEVADRLAAEPDSKTYGRLSVITQFCCDIERVLDIPARAFTPPPKVDSAVVHLTPRKNRPKDVSFKMMGRVTAAAFGQRRKMLRSSLKPLGGEELLKRAGIKPELRAENLSVADFENLARKFGM
jgi:16S rRNA (adenine1518-N6/adenine1519-N6)-dimethyltransferase